MHYRWARIYVVAAAVFAFGNPFAAGKAVSAQAPWPMGTVFEVTFTIVTSSCSPAYLRTFPKRLQLDQSAGKRVVVFPDAQPEHVAIAPVFRDENPEGDFGSIFVSRFPVESLGHLEMTSTLNMSAPNQAAGTVSGTLNYVNQPAMYADILPERQAHGQEILKSACTADLSLSARKVPSAPADVDYTEKIWTLLREHTNHTTNKDPARSIPPLDRGLEIPGPHQAEFLWRKSRSWFLVGEDLPLDDKEGRLKVFQTGLDVSKRALKLDPGNGAAQLFFAANLGRYNTTQGVFKMMFGLDDFEDAVLDAIRKGSDYSLFGFQIMGDAHNAMGRFYRLVPDNLLAQIILGVRGNIEKANDHNRKSLDYQPDRGDYLKEIGLSLTCTGTRNADSNALTEGRDFLRQAVLSNVWAYNTPEIDREHIRSLLRHPDHACGYSRDNYKPDIGVREFMQND